MGFPTIRKPQTHLWFWFKVHLIRVRLPSFGWKRWPQFNLWPAGWKRHLKPATSTQRFFYLYFPDASAPHPPTFPFHLRKHMCFGLSAAASISTSQQRRLTSRVMMSWSVMTVLQRSSSFKPKWKISPDKWQIPLKPPGDSTSWTPGLEQSVPTSPPPSFLWWCTSDGRVATTHLSTESTISSMHPLILFCASKWVMCSVDSPSIAKIMSPIHRFAWAALLPGVTYRLEQDFNLYTRFMENQLWLATTWKHHQTPAPPLRCLSNAFSDLWVLTVHISTGNPREAQLAAQVNRFLRANAPIREIKTVSGTGQEFLITFPWAERSDLTMVATSAEDMLPNKASDNSCQAPQRHRPKQEILITYIFKYFHNWMMWNITLCETDVLVRGKEELCDHRIGKYSVPQH